MERAGSRSSRSRRARPGVAKARQERQALPRSRSARQDSASPPASQAAASAKEQVGRARLPARRGQDNGQSSAGQTALSDRERAEIEIRVELKHLSKGQGRIWALLIGSLFSLAGLITYLHSDIKADMNRQFGEAKRDRAEIREEMKELREEMKEIREEQAEMKADLTEIKALLRRRR